MARTDAARGQEAALVSRFRRILLWLTMATVLGAGVELAMLRHWTSLTQRIPWVVLGVALLATGYALRAGQRARLSSRVAGLFVALASGLGVYEHVASNVQVGALDARFATTWDSLPALTQWWYAVSGVVGPAPALAPGLLALTGVLLALSTLGWSAAQGSSGAQASTRWRRASSAGM